MLAANVISGIKGNYAKVNNVSKNDSECNNSSNMYSTSNSLQNYEKPSTKDAPNKTKTTKRKYVVSNKVLPYLRSIPVKFVLNCIFDFEYKSY